ncbi:MAG: ribonuclease HII [Minisyncoccota bacterium]
MLRNDIGIDEAGRGPLAGPVAVGAVAVSRGALVSRHAWIRGIKDSKKLSERQREEWFEKIKTAQKNGWLRYAVVMKTAREIDRRGINRAISSALSSALKKLGSDPQIARVFLDGGLRAPHQFANQQTIVRGDEKKPLIALASIVAKVTRDRHMKKVANTYPVFGFEEHKGYGTRKHHEAIRTHGLSDIHRRSFCKRLH